MQGIFWFHMAQELANQGGVGLWKSVYKQMNASSNAAAASQAGKPAAGAGGGAGVEVTR